MGTWRSAGYVLRRLAWELFRIAGVLAVLYLAVDQYLLYRVQTLQAECAALHDELRPIPAKPWAGEGAAVALLPAVRYRELEAARDPAFAKTMEVVNARAKIVPFYWLGDGLPYDVKRALAKGAVLPETMQTVLRETRPTRLDEGPLSVADMRAQADNFSGAANTMLRYLFAVGAVQIHGGDIDAGMISLLLAGETVLLAQLDEATPLFNSDEIALSNRFLEFVHFALAANAVSHEDADRLIDILLRLHYNVGLTNARARLGRRDDEAPPFLYGLRPYDTYWVARTLQLDLETARRAGLRDPALRDQDLRARIAGITEQPERLENLYLEEVISQEETRDVVARHCAALILMLRLEQHRLREGHYPAAIDAWDDWTPAGLAPGSYAHYKMTYEVNTGRPGYQLRYRDPNTFWDLVIHPGEHKKLVRHYQEQPFE